jgi:hypothetical protein
MADAEVTYSFDEEVPETYYRIPEKAAVTRKEKISKLAKKLLGDRKRYSTLAHGAEKAGLLAGKDIFKAQKFLADLRLKQLQGYEKSGYKLTPDEEEMKRRLQAIAERDENLKVSIQKKLEEMSMTKEEQIARALRDEETAKKKLKELLGS